MLFSWPRRNPGAIEPPSPLGQADTLGEVPINHPPGLLSRSSNAAQPTQNGPGRLRDQRLDAVPEQREETGGLEVSCEPSRLLEGRAPLSVSREIGEMFDAMRDRCVAVDSVQDHANAFTLRALVDGPVEEEVGRVERFVLVEKDLLEVS